MDHGHRTGAAKPRRKPRPSSSSTRPKRCSRSRRPRPPGLVPLKTEETTELDKRVAQFVDELAALDSNSPEFGKKVDQLTAMGRKEIAEAAGASNRFLDRPVKAIDKDTGIGADLTELRRTVEALDPQGSDQDRRKLLGIIPFGNRVDRYFDKYRSSQTHISARSSAASATARTSC